MRKIHFTPAQKKRARQIAEKKRGNRTLKDYSLESQAKIRRGYRRWHLFDKYGLTLENYEALFLEQKGVCAVCGLPETFLRRGAVKSLDVDHNHETGRVRGLLCSACNASLGLLKENPARIRALADYIERY